MFVASYRRTMAGAKVVVHETPKPPPPPPPKPVLVQKKLITRPKADYLPSTSATQIIRQVADWHRLSLRDILSHRRSPPVDQARHDAIAAVFTNCRVAGRRPTLGEVGKIFDRNHATIIHSLRVSGLRR